MSKPFFSILIPTKNRSHLVGFAIQSVLDQSFGDFEIIVSDNDDSETMTRDAVACFSDPRIKYYRTSGNLSMPDNWEFALSKSVGQYITVLEDKHMFYPNALEVIHKCILSTGSKVVMWMNDGLDDTYKYPIFTRYCGENIIYTNSSDELLQYYLKTGDYGVFPRMINSCVCRDIVDFVLNRTLLKRFFCEINPDICAAFIQLNFVDYVTRIDSSLRLSMARSQSTSYKIGKSKQNLRFFKDIGDEDKFYNYVPVKSCYNVDNVVLNDYLRLRELLGGRLSKYTVSNEDYIIILFRSILESFFSGGAYKNELKLWWQYFHTQPARIRRSLYLPLARVFVKRFVRVYLSKRPRLWNVTCRLYSGPRENISKTRLFTGYTDVADILKDSRFLPEIIINDSSFGIKS